MNGRGRRNKGHSGERELAKLLGGKLGMDIARNLEQPRSGGADLFGLPGISVEVKRQEKMNINAWWQQACDQVCSGRVPVLAYRRNHQPWRFVVALCDLGGCSTPRTLEFTASLYLEGFLEWYTNERNT